MTDPLATAQHVIIDVTFRLFGETYTYPIDIKRLEVEKELNKQNGVETMLDSQYRRLTDDEFLFFVRRQVAALATAPFSPPLDLFEGEEALNLEEGDLLLLPPSAIVSVRARKITN